MAAGREAKPGEEWRDAPLAAALAALAQQGTRGDAIRLIGQRAVHLVEKRWAERVRWLRDRQLASVIEDSALGIAVVESPESRFLLANAAYRAMAGRRRAFVGRRAAELFAPAAAQALVAFLEEMFRTGHTVSVRGFALPAVQPSHWCLDHLPVRNDEGAVAGALVLAREVASEAQARRQAEETAAEARLLAAELDSLLAAVTDPVLFFDERGQPVRANARAARFLGFDMVSASRGMSLEQVAVRYPDGRRVAPLDVPSARALRGEPVAGELLLVSGADGGDRLVKVTALPLLTAGRVTGAVAVIHDVTEREQLLADLATERARLEAILHQMPAGVAIAEAGTGRLTLANEQLERLTGNPYVPFASSDPLGGSAAWHADGRPYEPEEHPLARALHTGEVVVGEELVLVDGEGRPCVLSVNAGPIRDRDGHIVAAVAVQLDVTDRRRSEDAYRALAAAVPAIVWTGLPDGTVDYLNERWAEYTGSYAEPGLAAWLEPVHHEDRDDVERAWHQACLQGGAFEAEYRLRRAFDGEYRWHLGRSLPLRDQGGRVVKWIGAAIDIEDQKRAAEAERRSRAELAEAVRAREDFLSAASHELKTPLTSLGLRVQGFLRRLAREPRDSVATEEVLETMRGVERQAWRLTKLVDNLLDVSRIQAGRLQLDLAEVDLAEVAAEVVDRFRAEPGHAGQLVSLRAGGPVTGRWDRLRIDQVVTNLVSNGVKYGRGQPVDVVVESAADEARLAVFDRGIGIPLDKQACIFDRFERGVTLRDYGGFGLGLWIVREIVRALGGRIEVASVPDEGSTFTVHLPRAGPA